MDVRDGSGTRTGWETAFSSPHTAERHERSVHRSASAHGAPPVRIETADVVPAAPVARGGGEVLYGAFGTVLRRTVCDAGCEDAEACPRRAECVYARLFEPAPIGPRFGETGGRKAFLFR